MAQSRGDPTVGFIETSHKMSSTFAASRFRLQTTLSVIVPKNKNLQNKSSAFVKWVPSSNSSSENV